MGEFYKVVKTIKGRRYLYWQKTYRVGRSVKTLNKYIGPYHGEILTRAKSQQTSPVTAHLFTLPLPFPKAQLGLSPEVVTTAIDAVMEHVECDNWDQAWSYISSGVTFPGFSAVEDALTSLGVDVRNGSSDGNFYDPTGNYINIIPCQCWYDTKSIGTNSARYRYYRTVCHELVHWTGHPTRLARPTGWDRPEYAREELVAELGSLMLLKALGFPKESTKIHAAYFQSYLERIPDKGRINKANALEWAKRHAEEAVKYVLEHGTVKPDVQHPRARPSRIAAAYSGQAAARENSIHDRPQHRTGTAGNRSPESSEKVETWLKSILANDESSSDEELVRFFKSEAGLSDAEAQAWIARRQEFLL